MSTCVVVLDDTEARPLFDEPRPGVVPDRLPLQLRLRLRHVLDVRDGDGPDLVGTIAVHVPTTGLDAVGGRPDYLVARETTRNLCLRGAAVGRGVVASSRDRDRHLGVGPDLLEVLEDGRSRRRS